MRAYEATLHVENPLSFRTNEYGNVVRTSRIIHNWALRFALNGLRGDPEKDHLENLRGASVYSTPAVPVSAEFEFQTFHPFPEAPQLLRNPERLTSGSRATYQGNYTILHYKEVVRPGSTFRFAVASPNDLPSEMVVSLGGKRSLQMVRLEPADSVSNPGPIKGIVSHPLNPLDYPGRVRLTNALQHAIPPSPLFEGEAHGTFEGMFVRKNANEYIIPPAW